MSECWRVAKPGAPICVFTDWRQLPITTDAIQGAEWIWRGILAWDKTEAVRPQLGRFRNQCEYVVWGSKGKMPSRKKIGAIPGAVRVSVGSEKKFHMTGKPVAVMRHLVRIADEGGLVLDPFAGAGATGVACLDENRRFLGLELDSHYYELCLERLGAAAPQ